MTIDISETINGSWIILETDDGGVSGPSIGMDSQLHWHSLYKKLVHCNYYNIVIIKTTNL